MVPRGCLLAAAATSAALLLACTVGSVDAAQACPSLSTKASTGALEGGKNAKLTVKISNRGASAVTDAGLALTLPYGFTFRSAAVSPKPNPAPTLVQDGSTVAWTGLSILSGKSRKVRVKLALDQCAGDTLVPSAKRKKAAKAHRELAGFGAPNGLYSAEISIATFTGPADNQQCLSSTTVEVRAGEGKGAEGRKGSEAGCDLTGLCTSFWPSSVTPIYHRLQSVAPRPPPIVRRPSPPPSWACAASRAAHRPTARPFTAAVSDGDWQLVKLHEHIQ